MPEVNAPSQQQPMELTSPSDVVTQQPVCSKQSLIMRRSSHYL